MFILRYFIAFDATIFKISDSSLLFSFLTALLRSSSTMLRRSGESGYPYLVLDLKEERLSAVHC